MLEHWNGPNNGPEAYFGEKDPDADHELNTSGWVVRRDIMDEESGVVTRFNAPKDPKLGILNLEPNYSTGHMRLLNKYLIYNPERADVRVIGIQSNPKFQSDYTLKQLLDGLKGKKYSVVDATERQIVLVNTIRATLLTS